jgi:hypothetical protein
MGKEFDELARALASGVSRRAALKRFAAGAVGAAFASVFTGRSADAQSPSSPPECQEICRQLVGPSSGREFGRCVSGCARCIARGGEPYFINNGEALCFGINGSV